MKRFGKILLLALAVLTALALVSCKKGDLPEGMKLASDEAKGYRLYVPEEWTVSEMGELTIAYVSAINHTSVSYTEVPAPEGSIEEYFEQSLAEYPVAPTILARDENAVFGNADTARRYIYQYVYEGDTYGVMQILATYGERFGILTYTALADAREGETSRYDTYLSKVKDVTEHFVFLEKRDTGAPSATYGKDEDGWDLVSDKRLCRFSLYLPEGMEVAYASGIVHAVYPDGASVTVSQVSAQSTTFAEYWETRKNELQRDLHVENLTVIGKGEGDETKEYEIQKLGDLENGFAYEYTYDYGGRSYHVYQVFGASRSFGFSFTFTAPGERYGEHIDEVKEIIRKIRF